MPPTVLQQVPRTIIAGADKLASVPGFFSPESLALGHSVRAKGRIEILTSKIGDTFAGISAIVSEFVDSRGFHTNLVVESYRAGEAQIDGDCDCGSDRSSEIAGGNLCGHVAALVMHLLHEPEDSVKPGATSASAAIDQSQRPAAAPGQAELPIENPTPVVRLQKVFPFAGSFGGKELFDAAVNAARLTYRYGDQIVLPERRDDVLEIWKENTVRRVRRNFVREKAFVTALKKCGMELLGDLFLFKELQDNFHENWFTFPLTRDAQDLDDVDGLRDDKLFGLSDKETHAQHWIRFLSTNRKGLEQQGWSFEIEGGFEFETLVPDEFYEEFEEAGVDWLDFECGMVVNGSRINLLPAIMSYLEDHARRTSPKELLEMDEHAIIHLYLEGDEMTESKMVAFPARRLGAILETLTELYDPSVLRATGRLRLHPIRAAQVMARSKKQKRVAILSKRAAHREMAEFAEILEGTHRSDVDVPACGEAGFQGELRSYQADGVRWLQFLREHNLGGVLADDMGLGKTVQTLCHLQLEKEAGRAVSPSLIIAPTSVASNWKAEAEKFTPGLKVLILQGANRQRYFPVVRHCDLLITSYPLLVRDLEMLREHEFHCVVLDEAQYIKNQESQTAKAAYQIRSRHRLCLSGTPMENHLGELWSLFNFLMPGFLGSLPQFQAVYQRPIEKESDVDRLEHLQERVGPFLLRRTKDKVATDLPPKTEIIRNIPLSSREAELYEIVRASVDEKVREEIAEHGVNASRMFILDALLKLRQLCCDSRLLRVRDDLLPASSSKLKELLEMLTQLLDEGRRVLIFSQFTSMLELIEAELRKEAMDYIKLTGQSRNRASLVKKFQSGEVPIFLISLRAGATGLNLTQADTVIHYDPWWNPAVENQATDRAYRIGQTKPVFVYKLITENTIEEKIVGLQQRKRLLMNSLLGANLGRMDLSLDEIQNLLAPLK